MKNARYWIWLQNVFGYGSAKIMRALENYDSAKDFYKAGVKGWKECRFLSSEDIAKLHNTNIKNSDAIIKHCEERRYDIITPEDENYPARLIRIKNPPAVLYVRGTLPDIDDEAAIAVVGTRKCSNLGTAIAGTLGYRLSRCGMMIVSGGAVGCDIAASKGALNAGAKSVIVMGCGLSCYYLPQNEKIRRAVAENGAVISEMQPLSRPSPFSFPIRNRLMSALSLAALVIEAPKRSGALITVDHALEQGKDVFAIPGSINSAEYSGNNRLLEDGAYPVYTPHDIVAEYMSEYPHKLNFENSYTPLGEDIMFKEIFRKLENRNKPKTADKAANADKTPDRADDKPKPEPNLSGINQKIYSFFTNEPINIDKIIDKLEIDPADAMVALTELEMEGLIRPCSGGRYEKA